MSDLRTRTVLVIGGTGNVGEGIVARLLASGADVVVTTRRPQTAAEVLGEGVRVVEGSFGTADEATATRTALSRAGVALTDVVASIGSWWSGDPVGGLDPAEFDTVIAGRMGAHFHAVNTLLPTLTGDSPTYTFLNGGAALRPVAGSGLVSISSAGQLMLGQVVAAEQADGPVTVTTIVADTPILTRSRPAGEAGWISADDIGDVCVAVVGGAKLGPVLHLADAEAARLVVAAT